MFGCVSPQIDLHLDKDRMIEDAAINGDIAALDYLLNAGHKLYPGNPICCLIVRRYF